ncbi:hypothetical protein POX_c04612 [Penicillium oxalicum]|uniref:hypothetical protein n=1 Tax=Penicillium oxalicum TaxID=69781 RepID=UPI0020B8BC16|nr:hypothetical protein POX_c04612 [Penicillium oxalicum]KAI2791735.1 hypothetical protein POX_c04612 [Penicillium oxalicum]
MKSCRASSSAQLSKPNFPKPNFPKPNFPKPNFPKPNFPKPNFPKPNFPEPNFPEPNFPEPRHTSVVTSSPEGRMLCDFDIFSHPESLPRLREELRILNEQIKIVQGLEHAKTRLAARASLDSNTLAKCDVFVRYINDNKSVNFNSEVRKLNLDELAFCSISFEERRLKSVAFHFKACSIRTYMTKAQVSCLDRPDIMRRLRRLSTESERNIFLELYMAAEEAAQDVHGNSLQLDAVSDEQMIDALPSHYPSTTANQPDAFEFPAARWTNIEKVFPTRIAAAARQVPPRLVDPNITDCVRSRFPRGRAGGDALIWLDLEAVGIQPMLCGTGPGIEIAQIQRVLGDTIFHAIEKSDLWKWEKEHGHLNKTECVKIKTYCHVELRVGYDTSIAQILFN